MQIDQPPPTRLIGLDLLRAVAILLVLFAHGPVPSTGEVPAVLKPVLAGLKLGGWVGVDLFFVLSGFLVAGLLMREHNKHGTVRAGRFLVRRGWKIYPPLIVFVLFVVAYNRVTLGYWPINRFIATALFVQNYTPGMQTHLWSLAVEEHAYLLLAGAFGVAALVAAKRKVSLSMSWLPWAIAGALVLVLALRVVNAQASPFGFFTHQFPTHLRIDGILAGALFAYFYHYHHQAAAALLQRFWLPMLVAGVVLILPPFIWTRQDSSFIYTYGLTTNYLAGLLMLGAVLGYRSSKNPLVRGLATIGRHSYSIYLWHMIAHYLLLAAINGELVARPTWDGPYLLHMGLYLLVTIVSGIVLSHLVEVPALRLRDRLSPSRTGALLPGDAAEPASDHADKPSEKTVVGGAQVA